MTKLAEIQEAIQQLAPSERQKLWYWLDEQREETPEMLAAIDEGLRLLEANGGKIKSRADLEALIQHVVQEEDAVLQTALRRQQESISGQVTGRPYQEVIASARAMLAKPDESHPAQGS